MGLDIYVGSFTRYYAHQWETVVQKAGREQGVQVVTMLRQAESPDAIKDPAIINTGVLQWRDLLLQGMRAAGSNVTALAWDEGLETPYFTDKPGWDCFGALLILASHEQAVVPVFSSRYPKKLPDSWQKDSRLQGATAAGGRYSHLLGCEVWLPVDLPDPFEGPRPNAQPCRFGSSIRLQQQLIELNGRTREAQTTSSHGDGTCRIRPTGHSTRWRRTVSPSRSGSSNPPTRISCR